MNLEATYEAARRGSLYPGLILDGGTAESRRQTAVEIARILLCDHESPGQRPCGFCSHCHRIVWPGEKEDLFHPDFRVLEQDLKTVTSVDATKDWLQQSQMRPFEARGQVFVIAAAETMSQGACNSILKTLEEPPTSAPRNFLLLTPSRLDLLPTVRSRSLAVYLGATEVLDQEVLEEVGTRVATILRAWSASGSGVYLLAAAEQLSAIEGFDNPRAGRPWSMAARIMIDLSTSGDFAPSLRSALAELASDFLMASPWRLRAVPPRRIFEGLLARRLGGLVTARSLR